MSADAFLDSNVLLYLVAADMAKAARATQLVEAGGVISVQILNEFANVATRKFAMKYPEVREMLSAVRTFCAVVPLTLETHELGLALAERYRFRIFDGVVVATALLTRCTTLYTEDLQHGQKIEGLTIRNPFSA